MEDYEVCHSNSVAELVDSHGKDVLHKCLNLFEEVSHKRQREGLSPVTFAAGVLNTILVAYTFGAHPENFWLLSAIEMLVLFSIRGYNQCRAKPLNQTLYWLDFCWVSSFLGCFLMIGLFIDAHTAGTMNVITHEQRRFVFLAYWAIGNGPLIFAVGALGNSLIFHDGNNLASLFIHYFPSLICYVLRWQRDRTVEAWPHVFELDYFDDVTVFEIYINGLILYSAWAVLYTFWMLVHGLKLPTRKRYDTVMHSIYRVGTFPSKTMVARWTGRSKAEEDRRAKEDDWEKKDLFTYMLGHMFACCIAMLFAPLSFKFWWLQSFVLVLMLVSATINGARRYTYYIVKSYGDALRKEMLEGDA